MKNKAAKIYYKKIKIKRGLHIFCSVLTEQPLSLKYLCPIDSNFLSLFSLEVSEDYSRTIKQKKHNLDF